MTAYTTGTASIPITGMPAVLNPFAPDWSRPFRVTREFKTTIQTSRSGKEQRRSLRNRPRKRLEYSLTLFGSSARTFNQIVKANVGRDLLVIDESRSVVTTSAMGTGNTVTVAAAPTWMSGLVALRYGQSQQMMTVVSVTGTTIALSEGGLWPAGTKIYPILSGRIAGGQLQQQLVTDAAQTASVTFEVRPLSEPDVDPPAAGTVFNGREVFLVKPNWSKAPEVTFTNAYEKVDFGFGAVSYFNPIAFVARAQQASYVGFSAAQIEAIENVFVRAKGQRGEFYMPTWQNDLPPMADAAVGNDTFLVAGPDVANYFAGDTVFAAVCICYNDGTYQFAKVHSVYASGGNSAVQCAAPLTRAIDSSVSMICWMPVHRFASDAMTTEWVTDSVAQTQLSVVSLEDLTPETL